MQKVYPIEYFFKLGIPSMQKVYPIEYFYKLGFPLCKRSIPLSKSSSWGSPLCKRSIPLSSSACRDSYRCKLVCLSVCLHVVVLDPFHPPLCLAPVIMSLFLPMQRNKQREKAFYSNEKTCKTTAASGRNYRLSR